MESREFDLVDGRRVTIIWVNGPPYLSVSYKKKIEEKCTGCDGKGGTGHYGCQFCKGRGTIFIWRTV